MRITTLLLMLGLPLAAEPPLTVTVAGVVHLQCSTAPNAVNEWQPCVGPITLTIPAGPKGDPGPAGPAGPSGTPGTPGNNGTTPTATTTAVKAKPLFHYVLPDGTEDYINLDRLVKAVVSYPQGIKTITVVEESNGRSTVVSVLTDENANKLQSRLNGLTE